MALSTYRTRLAAVQAKILEILQTGQEYTVQGSHTVRNPSLAELERQESYLRRLILRAKGHAGRTLPCFGGTEDE